MEREEVPVTEPPPVMELPVEPVTLHQVHRQIMEPAAFIRLVVLTIIQATIIRAQIRVITRPIHLPLIRRHRTPQHLPVIQTITRPVHPVQESHRLDRKVQLRNRTSWKRKIVVRLILVPTIIHHVGTVTDASEVRQKSTKNNRAMLAMPNFLR